MVAIKRLRPHGLVHSTAFSHVAIVPPSATTIYVGGQNSVDSSGNLVGHGDVAAQAAQALENVKFALLSANATIRDVVQWTVLVVDGTDVDAGYGAIASQLSSESPGLVTAARVSGLAVPGALVEISAVAAIMR